MRAAGRGPRSGGRSGPGRPRAWRNGPVLDAAIWGASAFIRALPAYVPMPEFSVDPDGEVSMEWIADRDRIFSISFGRSSRVTYAGLDGTDRWRGTEYFDGETVHPFLLRGIERIMG